jgi:hypothetical protein
MNLKNELSNQINYFENKNQLKTQIKDKLSFYHADDLNSRILTNDLIYIDIVSAFPSICNIIFREDKEFINKLNSIEVKLEKNIFISTNLNSDNLKLLNYLCKVLILNYTEVNYEVINVIEYVKDGIIIDGYKKDNIEIENIKFKTDNIQYYSRFSKTSFYKYKNKNDVIVKGNFKNPPPYINDILFDLIFNKHDYYNKEFYNLKIIYSDIFSNILRTNGFFDLVKYYYSFDNKYFINNSGGRINNLKELKPENTLRFFIFPLLYLFRTFEK